MSVFGIILVRSFPHLRWWENADQNNSKYRRTLFTQWGSLKLSNSCCILLVKYKWSMSINVLCTFITTISDAQITRGLRRSLRTLLLDFQCSKFGLELWNFIDQGRKIKCIYQVKWFRFIAVTSWSFLWVGGSVIGETSIGRFS